MAVANFEELCAGLCELAGFGPPRLQADPHGTLAFSMRLNGVVVSALQLKDAARTAVLVAEMGTPDEDKSQTMWSSLLMANAFLPGPHAPHFSRRPRSGESIMQWACCLDSISVTEAYQRVTRMVHVTQRWRADPLAENATTPGSDVKAAATAPLPDPAQDLSLQAFDALYREVCETLSLPHGELPVMQGACAFTVTHLQTAATVIHAPLLLKESALVVIQLGSTWDSSNPDTLVSAMEANFALMSQPMGAVLCQDPTRAALQLQYAYPMKDASASLLLSQIAQTASIVAQWDATLAQEAPTSGHSS